MTFCCEKLKNSSDNCGLRGSWIVPMENSGGEYWGILYRNYDYENAIKRPDEYSILTIEASGGIKFCPYCGAELALLWEKHPEELKDVIKRYQSYDLLGRS